MITLSFSDFYRRNWDDEGYELYIVKDSARGTLYVGISHGGVWQRWFVGAASHMYVDLDANLCGNSPIGREISVKLPASLEWRVELWTRDECVANLLFEGVETVGGRDTRKLSILDIEAYWIQALAPPFNGTHRATETSASTAKTSEDPAVQMGDASVEVAVERYLHFLHSRGNANTLKTYSHATNVFLGALRKAGVDPASFPVCGLDEQMIMDVVTQLDGYAPATRKLYTHAIMQFCAGLVADGLLQMNLQRTQRLLLKERAPRTVADASALPEDDIARLLKYVEEPTFANQPDETERLRALRDLAFLLTLADTGLRVHEACKLRRGDVDMNEALALVIGKGDKQATVRFSARSLKALKDYLAARAKLDGSSGKPLGALPLFARHDKGAGKKVKSMTTETGRNIVRERVAQALGESATGRITPRSLRHYFVTTVLRASGNLKIAQEMARHASISVTQRYAHLSNDELDKAYNEIFNQET